MTYIASVSLLFLGVVFGFSFRVGYGLHCWECNSHYDPNCGNPFKNQTMALTDCSQRPLKQDSGANSTICRKITQKVRGETRVIRSCGYYNPDDAGSCITRAGTHLVFMHYCQCSGDGCNGALHQVHPSSALHTLVILAASLLFVS